MFIIHIDLIEAVVITIIGLAFLAFLAAGVFCYFESRVAGFVNRVKNWFKR